MAVGDVSRLTIVGRFQAQNIVNTLHYHHDEQVADEHTVLKSILEAFQTDLQSGWAARHSVDYFLIGIKAFKHSGASKVPAFQALNDPGLVAGTPHPSFASRVITFYTDSANHRRRGRLQLSGAVNTMFDEDEGTVSAAEVALMQTFANLFLPVMVYSGDEFSLCIPDTDILPFEKVTAVRARNTPGVMRSRRVKGYFIG